MASARNISVKIVFKIFDLAKPASALIFGFSRFAFLWFGRRSAFKRLFGKVWTFLSWKKTCEKKATIRNDYIPVTSVKFWSSADCLLFGSAVVNTNESFKIFGYFEKSLFSSVIFVSSKNDFMKNCFSRLYIKDFKSLFFCSVLTAVILMFCFRKSVLIAKTFSMFQK